MRESISAQSCASVPPAPALMLKMQFFRSCGPFRKTFNSSESSSLKNLARSRVNSCSTCACATAGSASPSSSMTRKSSSCLPTVASGSILARSELASSIRVWAFSRLFQKLSPAINALISSRRFCNAATSKKPPQVGKFLRGVGDIRFNRVKHGGGEYRSQVPEARRENQRIDSSESRTAVCAIRLSSASCFCSFHFCHRCQSL